MFSKTCEYGIKAMIFVAQKSKEGSRVGIKEIAKGTAAPEHFIAKIMQELGRKKLVHSIKGPNGGFYMDQFDLKTSLADIVRALDGNSIYSDCVLGLKTCNEKKPCPVHDQYRDIKKNLIKMIEENTIGDFNTKLDSGKFFLVN
ncbi:MAG: Rrf2 family transcriptional regulator [Saprospiraceae bacterium]|nr:Rrf2 family transcriptional regulator [Saprospiraceae bacterium]